jgi:hypothetical protein
MNVHELSMARSINVTAPQLPLDSIHARAARDGADAATAWRIGAGRAWHGEDFHRL